jgi:hypothetical protein
MGGLFRSIFNLKYSVLLMDFTMYYFINWGEDGRIIPL